MTSENYTIETAAKAFNTTPRHIRALIQRGVLPHTIKIEGQKARHLLPEAVAYLKAYQVITTARAKAKQHA